MATYGMPYPSYPPTPQPPPYGNQSSRPVQVCLSWVPASSGQLPQRALQAGVQQTGGTLSVFISRARFGNELIPAKLVQSHPHVCVPYGGKEHCIQQYEVLCDTGLPCFGCGFAWAPCQGFNIPPNAIVGGHTANNEPLYIAKGFVNGDAVVGKVYGPHQCAYFPWGGVEHTSKQFEILVAQ